MAMLVPVLVASAAAGQLHVPSLGERIRQRRPRLRATRHLRLRQQARVERRLHLVVLELLPDADELHLPVAAWKVLGRYWERTRKVPQLPLPVAVLRVL